MIPCPVEKSGHPEFDTKLMDDCPICFVTEQGASEAVASYCPEEIDFSFVQVPPEEMMSFETYSVRAVLTLNTSKVDLVDQSLGGSYYQLSHTNVHSYVSLENVARAVDFSRF